MSLLARLIQSSALTHIIIITIIIITVTIITIIIIIVITITIILITIIIIITIIITCLSLLDFSNVHSCHCNILVLHILLYILDVNQFLNPIKNIN